MLNSPINYSALLDQIQAIKKPSTVLRRLKDLCQQHASDAPADINDQKSLRSDDKHQAHMLPSEQSPHNPSMADEKINDHHNTPFSANHISELDGPLLQNILAGLALCQGDVLVFIDGIYFAEHSRLSNHIQINFDCDQPQALENNDSLARPGPLLDSLFDHQPAVRINVSKRDESQYLTVLHHLTGKRALARQAMHVDVDEGCELHIQHQLYGQSAGESFLAQKITTHVAKGGTLHWQDGQHLSESTTVLCHQCHRIEGVLAYQVMTLGEGYVECDYQVDLLGKAAACQAYGVLMGAKEADSVQNWQMNHLAPQAQSDMHYTALLSDNAQGSWVGHAHVSKAGEGADVTQMSRQMLLGSFARMHAKPELTIYCDAVACRHGATVGQLDQEALFYLASRGLNQDQARLMLVWSFLQAGLMPKKPAISSMSNNAMLGQALLKMFGSQQKNRDEDLTKSMPQAIAILQEMWEEGADAIHI